MTVVRLGLVGFDERERFGLGLAFRHHPAFGYRPDEEPADILVVDGDAVGALQAVTSALAGGGVRGVVLLTLVRPYELEPQAMLRVLRKPVANRDILAALDDLAANLTDGVTPLPEGDPATPPVAPTAAAETAAQRPEEQAPPEPVPDIPTRPGADADDQPAPAEPPAPTDTPASTDTAAPAETPAPASVETTGSAAEEPVPALLGRVSLRQAGAVLTGIAVAELTDGPTVPVGSENERYAPANHLDGALASLISIAHAEQRSTALVADSDSLLYDPRSRHFTSSSYFEWLDALAASGTPCNRFIVTEPVDVFVAEFARRPADQVMWRSALLCSAGRLRTGIDRTAPSALAYWPDLAHLDLVDGMIQVLAAVSASSLSVEELVGAGHARSVVNATLSALAAVEALMAPPAVRRTWLATTPSDQPERRPRRRFRRPPR